ncbi:DNA cytosine methyltransferase [Vagococcus sp. BWB3-3]|uniref:Cytosine-specific methyltransferase n=1 Tax=Vagococcus allomyrinae TaxID=2794353 RepID=A0A940PBG4_9ENTE|nr:DNA cytosine methyltransferase [Vagococcus allomyrinae]MBP1040386.1 DNA cytosine methyltransferase [Vagococcus allomyrinae]
MLELFGGVGAPRKALINLGVEHKSIDYVEFNEKAVRSYNAMFDNRYAPQDVRGYDLKPDILVHGSPCQDYSIGGKQYGGNVEDGTRSSLMFETIQIIKNLGVWQPQVVIWENVPNVLSKRHISAFNRYISDLKDLGYTTSYEILNALDFGIPQNRRRLFAVSCLDGSVFDFSKLETTEPLHLSNYLESSFDDKYVLTQPSMIAKLPGSKKHPTFNGMLEEITTHALTITTKQLRCPNSGVIKVSDDTYRILTERECWRLMGFADDDFDLALKEHPGIKGKLNGTLYHQAGNSIVVQVLESLFKLLFSGNYDSGVMQESLF